jgi:hypothetical protein
VVASAWHVYSDSLDIGFQKISDVKRVIAFRGMEKADDGDKLSYG